MYELTVFFLFFYHQNVNLQNKKNIPTFLASSYNLIRLLSLRAFFNNGLYPVSHWSQLKKTGTGLTAYERLVERQSPSLFADEYLWGIVVN